MKTELYDTVCSVHFTIPIKERWERLIPPVYEKAADQKNIIQSGQKSYFEYIKFEQGILKFTADLKSDGAFCRRFLIVKLVKM